MDIELELCRRSWSLQKSSYKFYEAHGTAVILPFTGKLLPVNGKKTPSPPIPDVPHPEAVPSAAPLFRTVASVVPPDPPLTAATVAPQAATAGSPAPPSSGPPTRPMKAAQTSQATPDVKFVKKQLFQAPLQAASTIPASGPKKNYKMKEDDLWTKLFSL